MPDTELSDSQVKALFNLGLIAEAGINGVKCIAVMDLGKAHRDARHQETRLYT